MKVDFQTHTDHSPSCGWMPVSKLLTTASRRGFDALAITDHNTMAGYREAIAESPDDLLLVPAEEIDTPQGQIIGLFIDREIEPWQPPRTVIEEIHAQGGIAFAPHPFDELREGLTPLSAFVEDIDAIETINSRCIRSSYNARAQQFAAEHGVVGLGGSDAHFPHEVGTAYTEVTTTIEGDPDDRLAALRDAILDGEVVARGGRGTLFSHVGTKAVKLLNSL